jgi:hypothetical protein
MACPNFKKGLKMVSGPLGVKKPDLVGFLELRLQTRNIGCAPLESSARSSDVNVDQCDLRHL